MKKLILVILSIALFYTAYAQTTADPNAGLYLVKQHDNLYRLAIKYHVTVAQLMKWNNLPSIDITEGQYLRVPLANHKFPEPLPQTPSEQVAVVQPVSQTIPVVVDTIRRVDTIMAVIDQDSLKAQIVSILDERDARMAQRIAAAKALEKASQDSLGKIVYSGYISGYYANYSDSVGTGNYQKYPFTAPRSNQFGLNVATFTASYIDKRMRGTATFHYGDFVLSTWNTKFRYVQEVYAGFRVAKSLWIDGGFFKSYFGTESLLPKDNLTSSVTVGRTYEPLYQAGVRINYNPTDKLSIFVYIINGYNKFEDNNEKKSGGLRLTYTFNDKLNIGYSGYFGDDGLTGKHFRTANNLFANLTLHKFKLTAGGDVISQQNADLITQTQTVVAYSGLIIASFNFTPKYRLYTRAEMFNDQNAI
jgi:hypothetical protein